MTTLNAVKLQSREKQPGLIESPYITGDRKLKATGFTQQREEKPEPYNKRHRWGQPGPSQRLALSLHGGSRVLELPPHRQAQAQVSPCDPSAAGVAPISCPLTPDPTLRSQEQHLPHPPPPTDLRLGHGPVTEPLPLVAQGTGHSDSLGQSGSSWGEKGLVLYLIVEQREGVASTEEKQVVLVGEQQ